LSERSPCDEGVVSGEIGFAAKFEESTVQSKPEIKKDDVTPSLHPRQSRWSSIRWLDKTQPGQIFVTGRTERASVACGDDSALLGVRVSVDQNGTVVADPVVVGMYTDCRSTRLMLSVDNTNASLSERESWVQVVLSPEVTQRYRGNGWTSSLPLWIAVPDLQGSDFRA
jgi:hypothetical protein